MEAGHIAVGEQPESTTAGGARRKEHFEFGGSAPKPPGFSALSPGFNGSGPGLRPDPPNPGRWVGARGASPQSPYSGSEGEMLAKGFSTVVAAAPCGNHAVIRAEPCSQFGRAQPLRIAEPDIRCPRIELRAAGARQQFRSLRPCGCSSLCNMAVWTAQATRGYESRCLTFDVRG
jgi:hypothetical protein